MRTIIFLDYSNFFISWGKLYPTKRYDVLKIPDIFIKHANKVIASTCPDKTLAFEGLRLYASYNPARDKGLRNFLIYEIKSKPGIYVDLKDRRPSKKGIHCKNCDDVIVNCPKCNKPFMRASEKGVDAAIITDMFSLHIENVYDVAILITADSDMIGMVEYLQNRGVKVINASWRNIGSTLRSVCWASFEINDIATKLYQK
ncbi:MAG: NYN domain-containing protein [Calditrichaeota bacterium]|nr:NYN domain-containing protein [Calditrichota bacterium]